MTKAVSLDTGHNDGRLFGPKSPADMTPPSKRQPLPVMPLECPNCSSPDVDGEARECQACGIGIPFGAPIRRRRRYVTTRNQRIDGAALNTSNQRLNAQNWRAGR
jgi:hypothetical protein